MKEIADKLRLDLQSLAWKVHPTPEAIRHVMGELSRMIVQYSWDLTSPADKEKYCTGGRKPGPSELHLLKVIGCDTTSFTT